MNRNWSQLWGSQAGGTQAELPGEFQHGLLSQRHRDPGPSLEGSAAAAGGQRFGRELPGDTRGAGSDLEGDHAEGASSFGPSAAGAAPTATATASFLLIFVLSSVFGVLLFFFFVRCVHLDRPFLYTRHCLGMLHISFVCFLQLGQ